VVAVGPPGERGALFKAAGTTNGQLELRQQTTALAALHADPRLQHWTWLLPRVLGTAEIGPPGGSAYCVAETLLPGEPGPRMLADPARCGPFLSSAVAAIGELHRRTATLRRVDDPELAHWVHQPIAEISRVLPAGLRGEAARLAALLDARLRGRTVAVGWMHGDYLPVNVLAGPDGRVCAIVDWCTAGDGGMPVLDVAIFLQMAHAMRNGEELGPLVLRWASRTPPDEADLLARCQAALGASILAPELLILLAWLQHVSQCVSRSQRMAANPVWNRRNVRVVVRQAADILGTDPVPPARSPVTA
jgi:aminoglycoside phosphotransferase (APT) family kinase protein